MPTTGPFDRWGIDIKGPLPGTVTGMRYIIMAIDYFTKWPEARVTDNIRAPTVARFLFEDVICRYGVPKGIQTDNGKSFNCQLLQELTDRFGIRFDTSIPYHPESNGLVERFNRTLGTALSKFVQEEDRTWDRYVQSVLFAYRTTVQSSTRFSPFRLCYGLNGRLPIDLEWGTDQTDPNKDTPKTILDRAAQILCKLEPDRMAATRNLKMAQAKQKKFHDRHSKPIKFAKDDKVFVWLSERVGRHDYKLKPKWAGPLKIEKVLPHSTFLLRWLNNTPYHRPVHGNQLKLYKDQLFHPLVIIEDRPPEHENTTDNENSDNTDSE